MTPVWILEDLQSALEQFSAALAEPAASDVVKAGCIQYFEFTFELAWKACKIVGEDQGLPDCLSPRSCLRQAFAQGWISDEAIWLEMLESRNRMSHTYDARRALLIYSRLPDYLRALRSIQQALRAVIAS